MTSWSRFLVPERLNLLFFRNRSQPFYLILYILSVWTMWIVKTARTIIFLDNNSAFSFCRWRSTKSKIISICIPFKGVFFISYGSIIFIFIHLKVEFFVRFVSYRSLIWTKHSWIEITWITSCGTTPYEELSFVVGRVWLLVLWFDAVQRIMVQFFVTLLHC